MAKLWLTYAWVDNEDEQVDYIVQVLRDAGVDVHIDREHLVAGKRLWPQIDAAISDPSQSDGWAIYATRHSLSSEACLEEIAYALDRALRTRGPEFPLIGIFPEPLDRSMIPSAIATRLYVTLQDPNWASRVVSGLASLPPTGMNRKVEPFVIRRHSHSRELIVEVYPRAGRWYPAAVLVPEPEFSKLRLVSIGPPGVLPAAAMVSVGQVSTEGLRGRKVNHAITTLQSLYIYLTDYPSSLAFGQNHELWLMTAEELRRLPLVN